MKQKKLFQKYTLKAVENEQIQQKIDFATSKYYQAQEKGYKKFKNFEAAREYISKIKTEVLENYTEYFNTFKKNFLKKNGKILYAENAEQAQKQILGILLEHNVKTIVKSKSMATEEIELNHFLEKNKIEVWETDLGEFIVQIAEEKPFHIISPALHKSKQDVIKLYKEKFNIQGEPSINEITEFTRNFLRKKFYNAQAAITGANFLIADIGAIALTENEGNALLAFSLPKIHIIIAGYEKLIPSYKNLPLLWQTIAYRGTGQHITSYNSIISPSNDKKTYLILLNNGRKKILENEFDRQIFKCLRCGACFYYCPVYKSIGGHSYNTVYGGPMGIILSPLLFGLKEYGHLSYACTLCNKCTEICPAKIPLTDMILEIRARYVEQKYTPPTERLLMKLFAIFGTKRFLFNLNNHIKNFFTKPVISFLWGKKRTFPNFKKSFVKEYGKK